MKVKLDSKTLLTTAPIYYGDVFVFLIPPNSSGKRLILEMLTLQNLSGTCYIDFQ